MAPLNSEGPIFTDKRKLNYSFVRLFVRPSVRPFVRPSVRPFARSSVCPFVRLSVRPFVRSLVRTFVLSSFRLSVRPCVFLRNICSGQLLGSFRLTFTAPGTRKKLDGPELHGSELFQRNCQNVPGAAGAAAGAAAAFAACI